MSCRPSRTRSIASRPEGTAYGKAQDAFKNKEDLTFTDAEIDAGAAQMEHRG